ncbi:MFS general substrate transporter [Metschnikowia bicuspidata var. bicuspidata NRRL YB-4993]|uniref:MFS general substrate transporter n=1 Tax=Metschnikowia bicuspidata var. bicuspidata NRRL YB-4993 TaxID=869754 RepID=A0A1A0HEG2_9ASCO|nr:MFS general substrate transporter [Metschnikowia bicuspidata var. bicuspidata NRRL YB-4993]OBA22375.1 MFS general substrate transporter [Metschnikowia bicuspidata var. bicuspidata NRRL YB-4993]
MLSQKTPYVTDVQSLESSTPEAITYIGNKNLDYIQDFDHEAHPEEVSSDTVIRKMDKVLVFPMLVVYLLQFLDKVVLNYSNVMGMPTDLNFTGNQFSDLATFFFVAYIVGEPFQAFLLQKFAVHYVLGGNVIVWGIATLCCAAVQNYHGMLALRVILGFAEAAVVPCLILLTTNFYDRSKAAFRIGIFYSGLGFGQIFGGLLSFLFQLVDSTTFEGWRILFLVVGIINILTGLYVVVFIPPEPLKAKMLSPKEKFVLLETLTETKIGVVSHKFKPRQVVEMMLDPQCWLYLVISATISFSSNTISSFSAKDIVSFGFSAKQAALLNMPSGVVSIVTSWISTYFIMRGTTRYVAICVLLVPAICGAALMSFLPKSNKAGLLIGIYMINCITAPLAIVYSWASANVAGSTKRIGVTSLYISIGFALGNITGPQSYRAEDAPYYYPAKISMLATQAASFGLALVIAGIYYLRNKRRDSMALKENVEGLVLDVWSDLTDMQNKAFRYTY